MQLMTVHHKKLAIRNTAQFAMIPSIFPPFSLFICFAPPKASNQKYHAFCVDTIEVLPLSKAFFCLFVYWQSRFTGIIFFMQN
jgi:hypothetical protein